MTRCYGKTVSGRRIAAPCCAPQVNHEHDRLHADPAQAAAWDRIRGLYNGFGYIVMLSVVLSFWGGLQQALLKLLAADGIGFIRLFLSIQWLDYWEDLPGVLLIPPMVNLAPRAGPGRVAWILWLQRAAVVVVSACRGRSFVSDGTCARWATSSTALPVPGWWWACASTISDSRAAADSLARTQIKRARLDAELQGAQLQLLRAQIEPHFLFNSLAVVRALARNDRAATVDMLENLLRYFEAASPWLHEGEVPLAQELRLVEAYLAIYRARMGRRLTYSVDAPDGLAQQRVPAMMLLTLVENALKHGVGPAVEGGCIRVSATRERDALLVKVADSGRGMDVRDGHGTGLANIRQRLLMMYGTKAVLLLRSAEPHGVVASVLLPLRSAS